MLSKQQIRSIVALQQKKFRKTHRLFVVEGIKSVTEFLQSDYPVHHLYYTPQTAAKMNKIPHNVKSEEISNQDLKRISSLKTPQGVLALVGIPDDLPLPQQALRNTFHFVLDDIQDPGNLGTIIRTAAWFGFTRIICSLGSADAYNPKVVQASMGALAHVQVHYTDIATFATNSPVPVFGALLKGTPIHQTDFGSEGLIVFGNEGNGISAAVQAAIQYPVTIPRVGPAESLNVAVSAAIFCMELRRGSS